MPTPPEVQLDGDTRLLRVRYPSDGRMTGAQIYDPDTGTFIYEGPWSKDGLVELELPKQRGRYHVYISPVDEEAGWDYAAGRQFLLVDTEVDAGRAALLGSAYTTLRALRLRNRVKALGTVFTAPLRSLWANRNLIRSMVRRDILARYRGSFGDVFWAVLNPVLLMATYFFVFGIVLQTRFGADASRTGFVLYFLAGMLPWLPFAESIGRSPYVMAEHRNFIKKLVFPVEILPATQVLAALVTEAFALAVFLIGLFIARGDIATYVVWVPLLLVPQILFTLGLAWFLAALGVFVRDLGQVIGFLLTLWFFITPICYPESSLPAEIAPILMKNPMYALVRGYRDLLLENRLPGWPAIAKLWLTGGVAFFGGFAWFYKLRRSFADVI